MVCDFTPLEIDPCYAELLGLLRAKGTILTTYPAPNLAFKAGKYENVSKRGRVFINNYGGGNFLSEDGGHTSTPAHDIRPA